ncbi:hypothetical protein [Rhizobium indicum]|uniref:Uncharacterized protein n=1 Tax=Rhizobium indicum TaxID=2583231 RepID=A0ABX6PAT8_9HYPH|nr:hypothetical protein [Rhizobium indicum]QKK16074.1 hypothetical protein FFM53_006515 [Rhizobium indicum]
MQIPRRDELPSELVARAFVNRLMVDVRGNQIRCNTKTDMSIRSAVPPLASHHAPLPEQRSRLQSKWPLACP